MARSTCQLVAAVLALAGPATGCGLLFDADPAASRDASIPDASMRPMDATAEPDATAAPDAPIVEPEDGSVTFPDAGMCSDFPCRLVSPQCGCGAGEACYPVMDMAVCQPEGVTPEGSLCADESDCTAGSSCVVSPDDSFGVCQRTCYDATDCASAGGCLYIGTRWILGVGACEVVCDPIAGTGCPAGLYCTVTGSLTVEGISVFVTGCAEGSVAEGGDCATRQCRGDLVCITFGGSSSSCQRLCDPTDPMRCAGCTMVATVRGRAYGYCPG